VRVTDFYETPEPWTALRLGCNASRNARAVQDSRCPSSNYKAQARALLGCVACAHARGIDLLEQHSEGLRADVAAAWGMDVAPAYRERVSYGDFLAGHTRKPRRSGEKLRHKTHLTKILVFASTGGTYKWRFPVVSPSAEPRSVSRTSQVPIPRIQRRKQQSNSENRKFAVECQSKNLSRAFLKVELE
jgi:hypothetical protein